jgi:hypothetical protein
MREWGYNLFTCFSPGDFLGDLLADLDFLLGGVEGVVGVDDKSDLDSGEREEEYSRLTAGMMG